LINEGTFQPARPTIFVVDDDAAVRDALKLLLRSVGHAVETFGSAQEFLDAYGEDRAGCLVLDIRMPGMSGLELQQKLNEKHSILPIIFITGHGDVPMAVEAMQAGAVDFIQKPFRDQDLIDRINQALEKGQQQSRCARRAQRHSPPPGNTDAARARSARSRGARQGEQSDRRRSQAQSAHRGDSSRARDGKDAGVSLAHLVRMVLEVGQA
jgi:DNA-binding NtrC family response regulator